MQEWLEKYVGKAPSEFISAVFPILVVIIVCLIVIKLLMGIVKKTIRKSKLQKGLYTFVEKTVKVILYFIAILIVADMMNIPITSLLATFSVVGLAVSLAIQDTLANLISGIVLLTVRPFKIGDWIDVASISGTVSEINFMHTVIKTLDNKVVHLPNKDVTAAIVVNYSESEFRRVCISFDVSYKNKTQEVLDVIQEVVNNTPNVIKDKDMFLRVTSYKDSSIEYTIRVWTKNAKYWDVYFHLLDNVKIAFDKNGIEIPYNQLDVHVHNV